MSAGTSTAALGETMFLNIFLAKYDLKINPGTCSSIGFPKLSPSLTLHEIGPLGTKINFYVKDDKTI